MTGVSDLAARVKSKTSIIEIYTMASLYLIPVTLGDTPLSQVLPAYNKDIILGLRHFIVEEVRTAHHFETS